MVKIKDISIRAFRGVKELDLELDGKHLLLKGENGTGKSSIVEGLEFFFTGDLSAFRGEGMQSVSVRRHAAHILHEREDTRVAITFNPGDVRLRRSFEDVPSPPDAFRPYFEEAAGKTFILRRDQILEFVISPPSIRFKSIAGILGITDLDDIEQGFMGLKHILEGELSPKEEQRDDTLRELSHRLDERVTESGEILNLLNMKLRRAGMPELSSLEEVDEHAQTIITKLKSSKDIQRSLSLRTVAQEGDFSILANGLLEDMRELGRKIRELLENREKLKEISRLRFLEEGKRVVEDSDQNVCPLCMQGIDRENLFESIERRLVTLSGLSEEAGEIRKNASRIKEILKHRIEELGSRTKILDDIPELKSDQEELVAKKSSLEPLLGNVDSAGDLEEELNLEGFESIDTETGKILQSLTGRARTLYEEVQITEEEEKALSFIQLISVIKAHTQRLARLLEQIRANKKLHSRSEKVYFAFKNAKNSKLREVYQTIQEDINRFYARLHPGEAHENIELTPIRRASTDLRIESFGQESTHPKAYASEGHLDSLGFCIFLAFMKKINIECNLLVLDDVVTTIDAGHRKKICELLFEEFSNRQIIITTHDEIWFKEILAYQRAHGLGGAFVNTEIIGWDIDRGPILRRYQPRWQKILSKLQVGDKRGAGNEGRTYLEWLLKEICERIEAKVPYRESGKYTVGELFRPAWNRLTKKLLDNDYIRELNAAFESLEENQFMGNLLSHDSLETGSLSVGEVEDFCTSVRRLHDVLRCQSCGLMLNYVREVQEFRCTRTNCADPKIVRTR